MKYFIDFDRVLFDHDTLKQVISEKKLEHLYATPQLWDHVNSADFLYPDAISFLNTLPRQEIAIISAYTARIGPLAKPYQDRKLQDSRIATHVNEVVVMDGPKAPHIHSRSIGEGFFVDDKRQYVEEVQRACPQITCIQLLRPSAERTKFDIPQFPDMQIPVVSNLRQVTAIIAA